MKDNGYDTNRMMTVRGTGRGLICVLLSLIAERRIFLEGIWI